MKNLEEIDCNEDLWREITGDLQHSWPSLENETRFAFKTKSTRISEDDIDSAFWEKYPSADNIEVSQIRLKDDASNKEKRMRYFGVSMIIYTSGI